jgi:hypothetical protein
MRTITTDTIMGWIEQCDNQLEQLENAKDYIHYAYYERDLIDYGVEEDLKYHFRMLISEHKAKRMMLNKILTYATTTEDNTLAVQMFDHLFPSYVVNRLPEELRKEFMDYVHGI